MADLNEGRLDLPRSPARFIAFGVVAALLFTVLGGRLFQLQVLNGAVYSQRAAAARTAEVPIPAPRGLIFDRAGRAIAVNVPSWVVKARPADLPKGDAASIIRRVAALIGADPDPLQRRFDAYKGSPYDLVPLTTVDRDAALLIGERGQELPGILVEVQAQRRYLDENGKLDGSLMAHEVGYTGPISKAELADLADEGYLPDDPIGRDGVEASFESELRGTYGSELVERDASGRTTKVIDTLQKPVPGKNLMLTIDARTQRLATDALKWGMKAVGVTEGVTIVMNPQTGEILAMVSLPAYDNNKFASGISANDYQAYLAAPGKPLRNHAIADTYPPGSTFKLVTGLGALETGVTQPSQKWPTYGCYQIPGAPKGQCLFDWNRRGFGPLDIVGAFAESSDTFFYQMAVKLGIDRLGDAAAELGFGKPTGLRLPGEASGIVASTEWARRNGRPSLFTGELAQAGIGQNVIAVTPLQLLNAYAALANGGHLMRPMIVRGETDATGKLIKQYKPEIAGELSASAADQRVMRLASRQVITTGHAYNIRDLKLPGALSGKTGTAEFGELTKNKTLPFHSWFVAYLPSKAGATDADLAVVTFSYSATVPGNVSTEVVKYFLQKYFALDQDLRLDPQTFALVARNQN
jgi:penicillin-binding protein 2